MALRRGQWVTLKSPVTVVAAVIDGEPIAKTLPAGTLGIHHALDDARKYQHAGGPEQVAVTVERDADGQTVTRTAHFPGCTGFHQVDPKDGFETLRCVAVDPAILVPVTSREAIPAARLATMSPDFTPRA